MDLLKRNIDFRAKVVLAIIAFLIISLTGANALYQHWDAFAKMAWRLSLGYLALSAIMFCAALMLVVWLWARLIEALGYSIPFFTHLRYFTISNLAKRIPGTLWYVASRAYLYQHTGIKPTRIALASGLEVIISMISNIVISIAFAGSHLLRYLNAYFEVGLVLVFLVSLVLVLIHPRIVMLALEKLEKQKPEIVPGYGFLLSQVILHSGVWILGGLMFYSICAGITEISPAHITYVVGVWAVSSLFSNLILLLPANLGAKEISSTLLLAAIMPVPAAIVSALLSRVLVTTYEALWVLVTVWLARRAVASTANHYS